MICRPIRRTGLRGERGEELIEFAIGAILFLMVVFGTIEFGLAVWQYNLISDLAQEGARWASVRGSFSPAPASTTSVETFVRSRAVGMNPSNVSVTTTPAPSTLGPGSTITVVVNTTFTPLTSLIPHSAMTLQSTARMIMSR